jgi:VanZ family protein
MPRRISSAAPMALAWAVLIVYASLYPFTGWRTVTTASPLEWLWLPWPNWWDRFDIAANLVGYLPLGILGLIAWVRSGGDLRVGLVLVPLGGMLLSFGLESVQNLLPRRVPSRADWALNTAGSVLGALLAAALVRLGVVERWQAARERWFVPHSGLALALLVLWPFGLLFPPPVPLGLGGGLAHLPEVLARWLDGTPLEDWAVAMAGPPAAEPSFGALRTGVTTLLGLLAPCLIAGSVALPGWRRLLLPIGALTLGFAVTALSTALSFGPQHALAWQTGVVPPALAAGLLLALAATALPMRGSAGLGLVVLTALVALVLQAPADPYYAQSLQAWERGRFIHFHGLAQWIGWCWPYLALVYLLARVARRGDGGRL